ncbi:MAG: hypothetical protein AMXMBFR33_24950 [Candidatus Xenobia bacterium]
MEVGENGVANLLRRRAYILGTLLVLLPILVMMMVGLFVALDAGHGHSNAYFTRAASLCVAEAGMADALAQLEGNLAWNAGFSQKPMKDVRGQYTVTFNQGPGPFSPDDSINNSDGAHPDSWRGANTVPAGTVLVVVVAQVGSVERRLEALIGPSSSSIELSTPLLTSGRIRLEGNVNIDGVAALDDSTSVSADVHSNFLSGASNLIEWVASGGSLLIDGTVSSSGTSGSAINVTGGTVTGGTQVNEAQKPIPPVNIPAQIAAKSSSPGPVIVPLGQTNIPAGDYYVAGDLNLTGDLHLDGGSLYVQGKLTVNGSVSGNGSVYVGSSTVVHGDSDVNGQNAIALFSKGNVELRGFDGTAYLETVVNGNPTLTKHLTDGKWAIQELENNISSGWAGSDSNYLDSVSTTLGGPQGNLFPPAGRDQSTMWKLRDHLTNNVAAGPSRDFLIDRLDKIGRIYSQNGLVLGRPDAVAIANYNATGDTDGIWDAVNDGNVAALMPAVYSVTRQIDYNRIGAASFQGLVYTNGSFYCANEINVVGAIVVNNDGSSSPVTLDGHTVNPGDLFINNGCNVTFVEDFFDNGGMGGGSGPPGVLVWMGR